MILFFNNTSLVWLKLGKKLILQVKFWSSFAMDDDATFSHNNHHFCDDMVVSEFCCLVVSSASFVSRGVGRDEENCGRVWQTGRCGGSPPS